MKRAFMMLSALAGVAGLIAPATAETCDRACLKTFADGYFTALAKHDPAKLPVSADVKYTENGKFLKLGEGLWKTAGKAHDRLEIYDPERGGAAIEAAVDEKGKRDPVLVLLRLKVKDQKITEIETLLARKADSGILWAPQQLKSTPSVFHLSIRPAEQNSRLELMAASEAYWRAFETNGTPDYHPAPFLPDTNRYENGFQTTNDSVNGHEPHSAAQQFDTGMFKGAHINDRRYPVVDLERGVVLAIVRFGLREDAQPVGPTSSTPNSPFVAEMFAVNGGKIRAIEAVLAPGDPATPTPFMPAD